MSQERKRELVDQELKATLMGRRISPPETDEEVCTGCGQCVRVCPAYVLALEDGHSTVRYEGACTSCGHCFAICPEAAIRPPEAATVGEPIEVPKTPVSAEDILVHLRSRRSVRIFKKKPVSREDLERIVDAARYAPTGTNRQDRHFLVLDSVEKVDKLRGLVEGMLEGFFDKLDNRLMAALGRWRLGRQVMQAMSMYSNSYRYISSLEKRNSYFPLPYGQALILIHAESWDSTAQFNCGMALYAGTLMAHSMGLGTCFLGFVQAAANVDRPTKEWLQIPKGHECYGAMVVGHPAVKYRRLVERLPAEIRWL